MPSGNRPKTESVYHAPVGTGFEKMTAGEKKAHAKMHGDSPVGLANRSTATVFHEGGTLKKAGSNQRLSKVIRTAARDRANDPARRPNL